MYKAYITGRQSPLITIIQKSYRTILRYIKIFQLPAQDFADSLHLEEETISPELSPLETDSARFRAAAINIGRVSREKSLDYPLMANNSGNLLGRVHFAAAKATTFYTRVSLCSEFQAVDDCCVLLRGLSRRSIRCYAEICARRCV